MTEDEITHLATPLNVPQPIGRRVFAANLEAQRTDYYPGADNITKSVRLYDDSTGILRPINPTLVRVCNLDDDGVGGWAHASPSGIYTVDPLLGRIALPPGLPATLNLRVDFHYGFSADMGGGEYERGVVRDRRRRRRCCSAWCPE